MSIITLALLIWVWLAMLTIQMQDNKDKVINYVKNLEKEITRRTKTEAALSFARDELELRVSERTTQLVMANALLESQLDQRRNIETQLQSLYEQEHDLRNMLETEMQKRVEFLRTLVHELKTPLTSIMASSELLVMEVPEGPLLKVARTIHRSSDNLNRRIDELMDLARGEIGMLNIHCKPVNIAELLHGVEEEISPLICSHGQTLTMNLPEDFPRVWADEQRVRQVVMNILGNATKFLKDEGSITLSGWEKDGSMFIEIRDNGPGIAEEEQERLFQPYYRGEKDRQRFSGLGLGLALSKKLVELHGGEIWVSSTTGEGSAFTFSLPLEVRSLPGGVLPAREIPSVEGQSLCT